MSILSWLIQRPTRHASRGSTVGRPTWGSLVFVALLLDPCRAGAGPVLTLGENGPRASSGAGTLVFTFATDSISGMTTMGFFVGDALGIVNPTQGDVIVREPGGSAISDLLRFQNTKPGFGGVLLVFSDLDGGVDS